MKTIIYLVYRKNIPNIEPGVMTFPTRALALNFINDKRKEACDKLAVHNGYIFNDGEYPHTWSHDDGRLNDFQVVMSGDWYIQEIEYNDHGFNA